MALLFEIATLEWDRCIQIFLRLCFAQPELISISKGPKDFFFMKMVTSLELVIY